MAGLFLLEVNVGLLDLHPGPDLPVQKCELASHSGVGCKRLKELGLGMEAANVECRDQSGSLCAWLSLLLCFPPALRLFFVGGGGAGTRFPVAQAGLELDRHQG